MSQDLQAFVRDALARGIPREAIRAELAKAGWRPAEVEAALAAWADTPFAIPVPRRRAYTSAREAFLYLVLFVTLYTTAFNVGVLLFQFVDHWRPDPVLGRFDGTRSLGAVRNALAALLIAFPIFLALSALMGRTLRREPEKRGSRIRKWLTYVTLFVAALVIIGDLTFLVARALSGELAPRFVLKASAVLAIAGTVFGHYLADLRREERDGDEPVAARPGLLGRFAAVAVFVVMVGGFVLAGSPRRERVRQIDGQRVEDLRALSMAINAYHTDRLALPGSLDELLTEPNSLGARSARDPVSGAPYDYRPLDSLRYELCATFDSADSLAGRYDEPGRSPEFWKHGAGTHCYTFRVPRVPTAPVTVPSP